MLPSGPYSVMCSVCVDTCSRIPNGKNITLEQHSAKLGYVFLTPALKGNRRNNDVTPICATVTTTNMANIYKDAHAHYLDSGKYICLLFMEHFHCTCAENVLGPQIVEFGPGVTPSCCHMTPEGSTDDDSRP